MCLDQINLWVMDKWQKEQLGRDIKPSTINRTTTAIKAALNKGVEWGIIKENPLGKRKSLKVDKRGMVRCLRMKKNVCIKLSLLSLGNCP